MYPVVKTPKRKQNMYNSNVARYLKPILDRADNDEKKRLTAITESLVEKATPSIPEPKLGRKHVIKTSAKSKIELPPEFNGKDYVSFLLHIDAEIEHGLLLQYMYATYSLGGPQIPERHQDKVRGWQEIILGISKEEMGHLVSVQNVLRLIGSPLNLGRQDYPWDTPFYPFPFKLEPLNLISLAKYIYAEAPQEWLISDDPIAKEIRTKVESEVPHPNRVGALFDVLLELINDPDVIADDVFQSKTYPVQAKWDEWGRGYKGGNRGNNTQTNPPGAPNVLVIPLTSRDDAFNAINKIAEQGEATEDISSEPSHFHRFLTIYNEMKAMIADMESEGHDKWLPSRPVATNPYITGDDLDASPSEGKVSGETRDLITNPEAVLWGHLLNIRYRMLLMYLTHDFLLDGDINNSRVGAPRGTIINATFGEMYNIRSISTIMVQLPLSKKGGDKLAGPPFLTPYTLELPMDEPSRWRLHQDLLIASESIIAQLLAMVPEGDHKYLYSLREADQQLMQIVGGLAAYPGKKN
jgi:Ferritin-like